MNKHKDDPNDPASYREHLDDLSAAGIAMLSRVRREESFRIEVGTALAMAAAELFENGYINCRDFRNSDGTFEVARGSR